MIMRQTRDEGGGWQLILADLALILFLVTLAALASFPEGGRANDASETGASENGGLGAGDTARQARFAPSQALYRPGPGAPPLAQWLARQAPDPRATLTIYARHAGADEAASWAKARALAQEARGTGVAVRVVIERVDADRGVDGDADGGAAGVVTGLHASLAYDSTLPSPRRAAGR
jgi:hypothetical protein